MAFCGKCGNQVNEGVKFCPSCGAPMSAPEQQKQNTQNTQNDIAGKLQNLNNTADTTSSFDPADIEQNKIMAVLAYLSWLVLIPIFAAKNSKYAQFHANQGLVLAIVEIIWWVATSIITTVAYAIAWWLGSLLSTVLGLANLVFLVMLIIGILNAVNGKAKELPVIGKFRILK